MTSSQRATSTIPSPSDLDPLSSDPSEGEVLGVPSADSVTEDGFVHIHTSPVQRDAAMKALSSILNSKEDDTIVGTSHQPSHNLFVFSYYPVPCIHNMKVSEDLCDERRFQITLNS